MSSNAFYATSESVDPDPMLDLLAQEEEQYVAAEFAYLCSID